MKELVIDQQASIKESLVKLEKNKEKCLLVVSKNGVFIGTLNDGDIRRAIIKGANVDAKIKNYVHKKPFYLVPDDLRTKKGSELARLVKSKKSQHIDVIPVLNKKKKIIDLVTADKLSTNVYNNKSLNKVPLIIMAGGKGTRLKPFTDIFPKPLMPVNNLPAIEHIINYFEKSGVKRIYLTLNYKKKLIKSYFEDNKLHKLKYVEEKKALGTAGSIGLFKNKIKSNFFVCNCDTITKINLVKFYEYHLRGKFDITLTVATKKHGFPYGSCKLDKKGNFTKIIEKPFTNHLVNIGLYLIKPNIINMVSGKTISNMDELLTKAKKRRKKIGVFPVNDDSWIDVGEWSEYNKLILNSENKTSF